jgi:hypothetical protein
MVDRFLNLKRIKKIADYIISNLNYIETICDADQLMEAQLYVLESLEWYLNKAVELEYYEIAFNIQELNNLLYD